MSDEPVRTPEAMPLTKRDCLCGREIFDGDFRCTRCIAHAIVNDPGTREDKAYDEARQEEVDDVREGR